MAKIKFRASIAVTNGKNGNRCLVDSVSTHNFFHSILEIDRYEKIEHLKVHSASEASLVVGKGSVKQPFGEYRVEAFHTPSFSTNILSPGLLSKYYNITFSTDPPAASRVSSCIISKKTVLGNSDSIIPVTCFEISNGHFSIPLTPSSKTEPKSNTSGNASSSGQSVM